MKILFNKIKLKKVYTSKTVYYFMDSRYYEEIGKAVERAKKEGGDLTTQNLLYVVKIANNEANKTGVDVNDLIAVGTEAMKKVETKYDKNKNDNFVKMCGRYIRGELMNFINRQGGLVHIPVNHQKGFKKGQEAKENTNITYQSIEVDDYDKFGECDSYAFANEREEILRNGLNTLDEYGRKTIKMKLRMDEYKNLKQNNFKVMAEELELTIPIVRKIYNEALEKLSNYCQKEIN